jgi:transcriptional regulator with XRE-family HTH domain
VASRLATFIEAKRKERGIENDADLAAAAGVQRSVISYIMNTTDVSPTKRTLKKIADALGVPVQLLVALAGPEEDDRGQHSEMPASVEGLDPITIELLKTVPGLSDLTQYLAALDQRDREELLAIARMKLERRGVQS